MRSSKDLAQLLQPVWAKLQLHPSETTRTRGGGSARTAGILCNLCVSAYLCETPLPPRVAQFPPARGKHGREMPYILCCVWYKTCCGLTNMLPTYLVGGIRECFVWKSRSLIYLWEARRSREAPGATGEPLHSCHVTQLPKPLCAVRCLHLLSLLFRVYKLYEDFLSAEHNKALKESSDCLLNTWSNIYSLLLGSPQAHTHTHT